MILEVIFALAASQALKLSVLGGPPVPERPRGAIREDMEVKETTPLPFLGGLLDGIITDRINRAYDPSAQVVNRKFTEFSGLCTEMLLAYEATVQVRLSPPSARWPLSLRLFPTAAQCAQVSTRRMLAPRAPAQFPG
jgi:hypothetical protein